MKFINGGIPKLIIITKINIVDIVGDTFDIPVMKTIERFILPS